MGEVEKLRAELAAMTAERDAALNAVIKLGDRLQRECFGLNNEGDPIGGDPPAGWKPRAEKAEARVSELEAITAQRTMGQEPKAYRVRLQSDDAEEWSLLHPKAAVDYLDRDGFECQALYAALTPADATTALDRVRSQAKAEGMREAAELCMKASVFSVKYSDGENAIVISTLAQVKKEILAAADKEVGK